MDIRAQCPGEWLRLRIGIGEPIGSQRRDEFVVAPFHPRELPIIEKGLIKSVAALDIWLVFGSSAAQNECNNQDGAIPSVEEILKRRAERRAAMSAEKPPASGSGGGFSAAGKSASLKL